MRRMILAATAVALLALATAEPAAADQAVVVSATVPGLAVGQVIDGGAPVSLPEGTSALFLFASGRTVTVKGPYDGPLDRMSGGTPQQGRLAGLFGAERFSQTDLGAARAVGQGGGGAPGDLTAIDPSGP